MRPIRTLKEYESRYKNYKRKLFRFTKKEVEDFDKAAGTIGEHYVLKHRKWVLLGDTYYEIPRPIRWTWFRGLNAGVQIGTCVLLAGAVGGASYGTYYALTNKKDDAIAVIDSSLSDCLKITGIEKDAQGNTVIKLEMIGEEPAGKPKAKKGDHVLTDSECSLVGSGKTGTLTITKEAMNKYPGKIVIYLEKAPGEEITEKEWKEAFDYILNPTKDRNFYLKFTSDFTAQSDPNEFYVDGYKSYWKRKEDSNAPSFEYVYYDKSIPCLSDNSAFIYQPNSKIWSIESQEIAILSLDSYGYFSTLKELRNEFTLKDGKYCCSNVEVKIEMFGSEVTVNLDAQITFNKDKKVEHFYEEFSMSGSADKYKAEGTFSKIGETKIEDFPDFDSSYVNCLKFDDIGNKKCQVSFNNNYDLSDSGKIIIPDVYYDPNTKERLTVSTIGAFNDDKCKKNLKSITMPLPEVIVERAFENCLNLKTINFLNNESFWHGFYRGLNWRNNSGIAEIVCNDGKITDNTEIGRTTADTHEVKWNSTIYEGKFNKKSNLNAALINYVSQNSFKYITFIDDDKTQKIQLDYKSIKVIVGQNEYAYSDNPSEKQYKINSNYNIEFNELINENVVVYVMSDTMLTDNFSVKASSTEI